MDISDTDLLAYLDEALPVEQMARIERLLRTEPALGERLIAAQSQRDAGGHSLADIWRRHQLSCPSREQLGSYVLGVLDERQAGYIRLHLESVGCRVCQANLDDLRRTASPQPDAPQRREKYFQSSAARLRPTRN